MKANLTIIVGDRKITSLMQAVDMWEKGKVHGEVVEFVLKYKKEIKPEKWKRIIDKAREHFTFADQIVSLIHLTSIETEDVIYKNNKIVTPWVDHNVRIVSSGKSWFLLCEFMQGLGIKVETDDQRYITKP